MPPMKNVLAFWCGILALAFGSWLTAQEITPEAPADNRGSGDSAGLIDPQPSPEPALAVSPRAGIGGADFSSEPAEKTAEEESKWYAPKELPEKDLLAQRIMAFSSLAMILVGCGTLHLSYWGIRLLRETLGETRKASEASMIAANATRLAAEAAVAQAQQSRPWLIPIAATAERHLVGNAWHYSIDVVAKNVGSTPATNIEALLVRGTVFEKGKGILSAIPVEGSPYPYAMLLHNSTLRIGMRGLDENLFYQICGGPNRLAARLVMSYQYPGEKERHFTDVTVAIGNPTPFRQSDFQDNTFTLDATMIGGFVNLS